MFLAGENPSINARFYCVGGYKYVLNYFPACVIIKQNSSSKRGALELSKKELGLSGDDITAVKTIEVTHVVQQHYWKCMLTLEWGNDEWTILINDTYARDRYNDEEAFCRVKLPGRFPYMQPTELAAFLNSVPPCGPGYGGHRAIKAGEVSPLIQAAFDVRSEGAPKGR